MQRSAIACTALLLISAMTISIQPNAARAEAPTSQPAVSDWNVRDHTTLEQFRIQAHRGAGELAEENTLEAFQLGWKLGCIPESDIRTTSDGVIVAFHDNDFSRVVKDIPPDMAKKGVKDVTFVELQKLDVGSWKGDQFQGRHVRRISDVFALMSSKPERWLYLDIKNVDLAKLASEVKAAGVEKQVILASTKYKEDIQTWKKLLPDGQTLFWIGGTPEKQKQKFEDAEKNNFADITQVQIHVRMPDGVTTVDRNASNPFVQSDEFLISCGKTLREHHILYQTLPWGAATQETYWKLLDLGLMSFATDHPDVTWDAVKAYYAEKNKKHLLPLPPSEGWGEGGWGSDVLSYANHSDGQRTLTLTVSPRKRGPEAHGPTHDSNCSAVKLCSRICL